MSKEKPTSGDVFRHKALGWSVLLVGHRSPEEPLSRVFFSLSDRSFILTKEDEWDLIHLQRDFDFVGNLNGSVLEDFISKVIEHE